MHGADCTCLSADAIAAPVTPANGRLIDRANGPITSPGWEHNEAACDRLCSIDHAERGHRRSSSASPWLL